MTADNAPVSARTYLSEKRVCIAGLGLMGGSLALALRDKVGALHGVDPQKETLCLARERNVVDLATSDLQHGVSGADIVVLAAPVRVNLQMIGQLARILPAGVLLVDLSSTKREIINAMNALPEHVRAVGGHPMCGKEQSGLAHAEATLFSGQAFVLCRTDRTDGLALQQAETLARATGATPLLIDPEIHDRAVARVSHLPYLLAAALVHSASELTPESLGLAASGYRDTSRLAQSDPEMMADVLLTNRQHVLEAVTSTRAQLDTLAELLRQRDGAALRRYGATVQASRRAWEQSPEAAHEHEPDPSKEGD